MDEFIGRKIEQFLIETYVGQGKTGAVYQACDLNLGRSLAVKLVWPTITAVPSLQKQLSQATRAISSLAHPSIVTLYSTGFQHGRIYIVTDYVNGMSLGNALIRLKKHRQAMPLTEVVHIAAQIADALSSAHQAGRRHLNLKPENILLKRRQRPVRPGDSAIRPMLTDFGLALIPETGLPTAVADLQSNFPYLSPEQCHLKPVDGRSDIYSLGAILYHMLAGQPPFMPQTAVAAMHSHLQEMVPPLEAIRPDISPALCHIVHTALAKEPMDRYQLAEQMADELRQLIQPTHRAKLASRSTAVATLAASAKRALAAAPATPQPTTDELATDIHVIDMPEGATQLLVVRQGRQPRQVRLNKARILIGRAKDSDIVLNQRHISRRHALLEWVNGRWRLLDLGSRSGLFLDGRRLSPHMPETWAVGQVLQIGTYFLHWVGRNQSWNLGNVNEDPPTELIPISPTASHVQSSHGRFALSVDPALLTLRPGQQLPLQVALFNQSGQPCSLSLTVRGLPEPVYKLLQPSLTLMPGAQANLVLMLHCPPLSAEPLAAGSYPFELVAQTAVPEPETAVVGGLLSVEGVPQFSLTRVGPVTELKHGQATSFLLRNQGNVALSAAVKASDEAEQLQLEVQPTAVRLDAGAVATVVVRVVAGPRPWVGRAQTHPFRMEVQADNGRVKSEVAHVRLAPRIPTWWLALVGLLCLLVWLATAVGA